jgi:hypothetical protein
VRCGRCGNENKEGNRFCGMCGAPLAANAPVAVTRTPTVPQPNAPSRVPSPAAPLRATTPNVTAAQPQAPQTQNAFQEPSSNAAVTRPASAPGAASGRRVEQLSDSQRERRYSEPAPESSITGPSFLGLNTPIARSGGGGDGNSDDRYSDSYSGRRDSSDNLDYLLEDEEEPKRGWIKVLVGLVALALAAGLGYLHYQQGGFEFLRNGAQKPATATPDSAPGAANSAGQSGASTPDNNSAPPSAALAATANPAAPTNSDSNSPTTAPTQNSQNPPAAQAAATQNAAPGNAAPAGPIGAAADSGTPTASTPVASTAAAQPAAKSEESSDSDEESSDAEAPAPKAAATKPTAKPAAAKPSPAKAIDRVQEAERYIYGRGVAQDCDHGVRLLKADQGDAKAMISLGGLYTTGTCTPRDLPTAYRWFAMALHKQPDNQALQNDLQKLWSQMTQPERQLAIKLSQ